MRASAVVVLGLGSFVSAATQKCTGSNICFSLSIPDATVSSGDGDVFFQLSAPTSMAWVALGQGDSMSGSNIFVMYTSARERGVTVSPRLVQGYVEPQYNADARIELLEGSGVSDGIMTANVKCSNCRSWSGGSMDFTSSSGSWIYAYNSGEPLNTDDTSARIRQHNDQGVFDFDFTAARGDNSANPFASASSATTGGSDGGATRTARCTPKATANGASTAAGSVPTNSNDSSRSRSLSARQATGEGDACPEGYERDGSSSSSLDSTLLGSSSSASERRRRILIAHGVLASLVFVMLLPAGAIAIRVLNFSGLVKLHAAWQIFAYLTFVAAFGLGVYIAKELEYLDNHHPVIGMVIFGVLFFQPILGYLHHNAFKKYGARTFWSHAHIWLGRTIIIIGMINGGLGLRLANNTNSGKIAYGVVAGIMGVLYLAAIFYGERKRVTSK